ncbi:MAG: hypothetical protein KatS3mg109_0623 [Pirellulaceae bacterium]|nr:MAG: hypothetical protein KatS3mg109_0623 [Pirellulaceae bacterium]
MNRIPRRTFLKGVGLSVGLPMLDAMSAGRLLAGSASSKPPVRMAFVFFPNGCIMPAWRPAEEGADYRMPETLEVLSHLRSDFNVLTGLTQDNGRAKGDGPGDHARSAASFLTGAHPVKTAGTDIRVGVSVDQVAAARIGHLTKLPSLELGIEPGRNAGSCDSGYSCAYSNNISWKTESTPMAKEIRPRLVFERLFGDQNQGQSSLGLRAYYRKSILDLVAEDAARLQKRLGQNDRRKLDEYFTSVRELEQRIERVEQQHASVAPELEVPAGIPPDLVEHIRLMFDLLVLAFRTDTTRIATFMLANEGSNRAYRMVGVTDGHHELSHHQNRPEKIEQIKKIDRFLLSQFGYFLEQLKAIPEGEGTLLDNCMIVYGGGLADGNRHEHHDLPILLAGRGGGTIQTGRHIRYPRETPLNNLFLSMLDRVGAPTDQLGDSTGRLPRLDG